MRLKVSIILKLLIWFSCFFIIFCSTIVIFHTDIRKMMLISDNIVAKYYKISSSSKKMIESLLSMEKNEKKYNLLKQSDYIEYFITALKKYEANLDKIRQIPNLSVSSSKRWKQLYNEYLTSTEHLKNVDVQNENDSLWIPEYTIDAWVETISAARSENEKSIVLANLKLNLLGQKALSKSLHGLGISILVGLAGGLFLSYSMMRPLRELRRGIRDVAKGNYNNPIQVRSHDEFGELGDAFNRMAARLAEEERMRSDFISMLSHEIRTPLTSIGESVNMMKEKVLGSITPKQSKFLKIASAEINRIREMLNQLMQVSQLESSVIKMRFRLFNPASLVIHCIHNLEPLTEGKEIRVQKIIPAQLPKVKGDPKHIQQVLYNLIGNAIKFSSSGTIISVNISLTKGGESIIFSVSDTGSGIPENEQNMVFNKYYRAKIVRDQMGGAGLGLNISKQIVQAHKGTIWLKSEVGKGSTFAFKLPLRHKKNNTS